MKLLALETSTESCSVALRVGEEVRVRRHAGAREQTAHVLPMVQALISEAGIRLQDLDAIACAHGPGAFTGVRVAVSVTQGLAYGAQVPAIGISTLAALAQQAVREILTFTSEPDVESGAAKKGSESFLRAKMTPTPFSLCILPVLDARMGELYAGAYQVDADGLVIALAPDRLVRPEDFAVGVPALPAGACWQAIGSGWPVLAAPSCAHIATLPLADAPPRVAEPDAIDVLALAVRALVHGEAVAAAQLLPVYLRDTVTWKKLAEQGKR